MLEGRPVYIVEDELLIADVLSAMLEDLGAGAIDHAGDMRAALALAATTPAALALVDLNLGDHVAWPVVDTLQARGIRVLLMSGDGEATRADGRGALGLLRKPYQMVELEDALRETLAVI